MTDPTLHAFVAGATGLTGRAVVRHLRDRGIETTAHVRNDSSQRDAHRAQFEALGAHVDFTPWEEEAFVRTLRQVLPTHVFALLGTTKKRSRAVARAGHDPSSETYEAVDYGLTALMRRACEQLDHKPCFIYLSSLGVSDTTKNAYLAARAKLERELREGTLPYVIVRPSFITGDRDESRPGEAIGAAVANTALGFIGALGGKKTRDRYRSITGDELGRQIVRRALDPSSYGKVFEADALREGAPEHARHA